MTFFAKNLSYIHESGRKSIMELLSAIIAKFQVALVREYADLLFVALVMVVANDDSSKCREIAAHLIRSLFSRLDEEHRNTILSHLHSWAAQQAQPQLTWVSSQVYGFIVDELQAESLPYISSILKDLRTALQRSSLSIEASEEEDEASSMDIDLEWQVPYYALTILFKILRVFPELAAQDDKIAWNLVSSHLLYPHAWVRTAACRLLGLLFTAVPVAIPRIDLDAGHPLSREGMQDTAKKLCQQLKSENLDEALGLQVVKNLFYVGKCFYLILIVNPSAIEDDAEEMLDNEADEGTKVDEEKSKNLNPLPWLFSKLSYQVKSAHIARRSRAKCSVSSFLVFIEPYI
jgi:U3 small nucleolar RNA-associated protein 20